MSKKKKKAPAITDPEVKTKKVQLDLGGDTTEAGQKQKAPVPTSSQQSNDHGQINQQDKKTANPSKTYYVIGGSFKVDTNAKNLRNDLKENGFDPVIIKMEDSDIQLVAYRGYNNLDSAQTGLADIQQDHNAEAWLYTAK